MTAHQGVCKCKTCKERRDFFTRQAQQYEDDFNASTIKISERIVAYRHKGGASVYYSASNNPNDSIDERFVHNFSVAEIEALAALFTINT